MSRTHRVIYLLTFQEAAREAADRKAWILKMSNVGGDGSASVCVCVCVMICIYINMYVCMCVYIHVYNYICMCVRECGWRR